MKILRAVLTLILFTVGCGGGISIVQAGSTPPANSNTIVVTGPTLLSSDVTGNYTVQGGSLYGSPASPRSAVTIHGNVTITGSDVMLAYLRVDGCILVDRANRVDLQYVWQQNCTGDGITYMSDNLNSSTGNQSCCGHLDHVFAGWNTGAGLNATNTADLFITNSEFENNGGYGAIFTSSPTARISNSDFGGNVLGGLMADSASAMTQMSNNQFGNNTGDDVVLQSQNNVVNGQVSIGPRAGCAIRYTGAQAIGANFYGPRSVCH